MLIALGLILALPGAVALYLPLATELSFVATAKKEQFAFVSLFSGFGLIALGLVL